MKLSPFGPPRDEPRRPDIGDMRHFTKQALVTIGLVPLGLGLAGAVGTGSTLNFWAGLALAGLYITTAYALSFRFESAHLGESRAFWRDQEARIRPRMFLLSLGAFAAMTGLLVAACWGAHWELAAFLLAPDFVAGAQVLLLWGKVP